MSIEEKLLSGASLNLNPNETKLINLIKLFESDNYYFTEEEMKKQTEDIIKLNIDYKSKCKLLKDNLKTNKNYNKLNEHYPNLTKKNDIELLFKIYELYNKLSDLNMTQD